MKRNPRQAKKKTACVPKRRGGAVNIAGGRERNGIIVFDSALSETFAAKERNPYNLEMSVLHQISKVIVRRKNVSLLLNEVMEILFREMGLLRGTITLRQGNLLVIEASHGLSDSARQRGVYRMGEGITGRVAKSAKSMIVPDISRCDEFLNRTRARDASRPTAFLCVPIIYAGEVIGTMSIDREVSPDSDLERDLHLLETIANILADAVSGLYLYHEERDKLIAENKTLRQRLDDKFRPENIVGNCGGMQRVFELMARVSENDAPVLILGEPGTGKKLVARAIASSGKYKGKPVRELSCASVPDSILEAELFGSRKSSSGREPKALEGLLEQASGGTLILDGIGEISRYMQLRLLEFLAENEHSEGRKRAAEKTRIICVWSRRPGEALKSGAFDEDLYYRLSVFTITLPPLRERGSDIILLAEHFLEKYNARYAKKIARISTPAINMLMAYHYPGNVRELENCIERAVLLSADGVISGYNLPPSLQTGQSTGTSRINPDDTVDFKLMLSGFEREIITEALKLHWGNAAAAARQLNLTERIMNYKIRKLGILPKNFKIFK